MKIGLFGGTFNPFHFGHLKITRFVKKQYGLDRVYLIPSATPPHKPGSDLAPASDRYTMVKNCIVNEPGLHISDKELTRTGPSFTIDTILEFKKELQTDAHLFLLMGSDAFLDINTWKQTDRIFSITSIIVMLRGELDNMDHIAAFIDEHISKGYTWEKNINEFTHGDKQTIYICRVPKIDISSTMIREYIKNHRSVDGLVPPDVAAFIKQKELYV